VRIFRAREARPRKITNEAREGVRKAEGFAHPLSRMLKINKFNCIPNFKMDNKDFQADIAALADEILSNPVQEGLSDRIDSLTDAQVTELRKQLHPYGRTIQGSEKYSCISYTSLSERFAQHLTVTSVVGFLYRMASEQDEDAYVDPNVRAQLKNVPIDDLAPETKQAVIKEFLDHWFEFNPDNHVKASYDMNSAKRNPNAATEFPLRNPSATPSTQSSVPTAQPVSTETEGISATVPEVLQHRPPIDTFHRLNRYTEAHYEQLRKATTLIYHDEPEFELAINIYDTFNTLDEAKAFQTKHADEVITAIKTVKHATWVLTGPFKENREKVEFFNKNTQIMEGIFAQLEQDTKLGADLMRKRVKVKKAQNVAETGPDNASFGVFKTNQPPPVYSMGGEDVNRHDPTLRTSAQVGKPVPRQSASLSSSASTPTAANLTSASASSNAAVPAQSTSASTTTSASALTSASTASAPAQRQSTLTAPVSDECPDDAVEVGVISFAKGGKEMRTDKFYTKAEKPSAPDAKEYA